MVPLFAFLAADSACMYGLMYRRGVVNVPLRRKPSMSETNTTLRGKAIRLVLEFLSIKYSVP